MGSWKLEVNRMFLYVFFPVAMFHIFNQPNIFEGWVNKTKQESYPPDSLTSVKKKEHFEKIKSDYQDWYYDKMKAEAAKK